MGRKIAKWYKPSKKETGWSKKDSATTRRRKALKAHKSYLSAGRALQSLANVTQDKRTAQLAAQDARYFYRKHEQSK